MLAKGGYLFGTQLFLLILSSLFYFRKAATFSSSVRVNFKNRSPSAPWPICDKELIYQGHNEPLLMQTVTVHGGRVDFDILLPDASPQSPIRWEESSAIFSAMDRTETMMVAAYEHILTNSGLRPSTSIVVDVGVHEGYFASVAHHFGYRVIGFDMQPLCALLARCTSASNGALKHVIFNNYVGHGDTVLNVGNGVCGGTNGVGWKPTGTSTSSVSPVSIATFFLDKENKKSYSFPQPLEIAILKSDTEGYEPIVLETALAILPNVHNILIELFPSNWERNGIDVSRGHALFECLFAAGMEAVDLPRKDIDYQTPGAIDLSAIPLNRIHSKWADFKTVILNAKNGLNGLTNPNIWLRWTKVGDAARSALNLQTLSECKVSLQNAHK
jgi:hypothetical protein